MVGLKETQQKAKVSSYQDYASVLIAVVEDDGDDEELKEIALVTKVDKLDFVS